MYLCSIYTTTSYNSISPWFLGLGDELRNVCPNHDDMRIPHCNTGISLACPFFVSLSWVKVSQDFCLMVGLYLTLDRKGVCPDASWRVVSEDSWRMTTEIYCLLLVEDPRMLYAMGQDGHCRRRCHVKSPVAVSEEIVSTKAYSLAKYNYLQ